MVTMVIVMMMYNLMVRTSVKIVDLSYTRKNADCIWLLSVYNNVVNNVVTILFNHRQCYNNSITSCNSHVNKSVETILLKQG